MKWLGRLIALLVMWLAAVAAWIAVGPAENRRDTADAALVLGAAVDGDKPSPVFAARIDHAAALYEAGSVERIVFTGGQGRGDMSTEGDAGKRYAIAANVPAHALLVERRSRTTFQNLSLAQLILNEAGIDTIMIVSDPLHLSRALQMSGSLGLDASASAATGTRYRSWRTKLPFLLREVYFMHHFWLFGE